MSILAAKPSSRDARTYLASFGIRHRPSPNLQLATADESPLPSLYSTIHPPLLSDKQESLLSTPAHDILQRTALVKVQGPFTDHQLEKIARQLVYLHKLGLTSIVVVSTEYVPDASHELVREETLRFAHALELLGGRTRPILHPLVRISDREQLNKDVAATTRWDIDVIRSALRDREFPIIAPVGMDSHCRVTTTHANDVVAALNLGLANFAGAHSIQGESMAPVRLLIINNEGGIPSYARAGNPHLLVNLAAEYTHIQSTFHPSWHDSHPTAMSNLSLAKSSLSHMSSGSSALITSHTDLSPMIGSLITNKPAMSCSLPPSRLQRNSHTSSHIATLVRLGLPIRVVRSMAEVDRDELTNLLEASFGRRLDQDCYYSRLERSLDFAIVIGNYAGVAIVTEEVSSPSAPRMPYLDKFAVLPHHQGDGTVDFLWIALHDESYGLGMPYSANPNGGKGGYGTARDLFWRSKADNPINKWYFERSSGHMRCGEWVLFWCDAEHITDSSEISFIPALDTGRIDLWSDAIRRIPSSWL